MRIQLWNPIATPGRPGPFTRSIVLSVVVLTGLVLSPPAARAAEPASQVRVTTNMGDFVIEVLPDRVIGQISFSSGGQPNPGGVSAKTLSMASNGQLLAANLAIDAAGNLWVTDPGNNRVLRFPVARQRSMHRFADISELERVRFVMKDGQVVRNDLASQ